MKRRPSCSPPGERAEFLWLHFSLANAASGRWLREHTRLPDTFFETQDSASTRLEVTDDALTGMLNDMQFFAVEASAASTMTLHVTPGLLVTAHATASARSIGSARRSGPARSSPRRPDLLAHLLRDQADVLVAIVRDATSGRCDRGSHPQPRRGSRQQLGMIRRVLVRLKRLLAPEPAALFRLLNKPPAWLTESDLAELRSSAEELTAAVTDSVALGERVRLLQEELTVILSERTNETLFILTVVTVLALPLTIIPGLFGMNVGGVPSPIVPVDSGSSSFSSRHRRSGCNARRAVARQTLIPPPCRAGDFARYSAFTPGSRNRYTGSLSSARMNWRNWMRCGTCGRHDVCSGPGGDHSAERAGKGWCRSVGTRGLESVFRWFMGRPALLAAAGGDGGVPNLIADMNAQRLAFSVHDGDLKQGSGSPCDEALCNRSLGYFNALEAPAMFTPGDNDWTDCDRPANGGFPHWIGWTTSDGCSSAHPIHWASGGCRRRCRQTRSAVASAARLCLRREPALDDAGRDLRDDEHPGLVQ